ncbi:MAG: PCYCGC domain-containing protein [Anaerolineae bacterium]|jgi:hypothetical protein|nr:PCYCGC domain-containing protein [Anaerolineae bacterium]
MSRKIPIFLVLIALSMLTAACAQQSNSVQLAPESALPDMVKKAPASVRTAYQFAVANPAALENVPCYCGCGSIDHHSNLACYVKEMKSDGKVVFDNHALGCSICVDIALDVMKMTEAGKPGADIREQIVATYGSFGPSNQ